MFVLEDEGMSVVKYFPACGGKVSCDKESKNLHRNIVQVNYLL